MTYIIIIKLDEYLQRPVVMTGVSSKLYHVQRSRLSKRD